MNNFEITTTPMATAFCKHGWVTVVRRENEINVFSFGTSKESEIGKIEAYENRDAFTALAEAAKTKLETIA